MTKADVKKMLITIGHHTRILFTGFKRMIYGTLTIALFAVAAFGFVTIATEEGYAAVFDFVASIATIIVAVANMYVLGSTKKTKSERKGGSK